MSYILRRQRWLQKPPPNATAIDWNHPLAQGLAVAILFNENGAAPRDYVRMLPGTVAAGTPLAQLGGTRLQSDCWSWDGTVIPDSAFTGDITLIERVNVLSGGSYRHFAGKHATSGATNNPFDWRTKSDTSAQALIRGSSGFTELDGGTIDIGAERQYAVSCTANMSAAFFYKDRTPDTNASIPVTVAGSNAALRIGLRADGGVGSDNIVQYFYGYSRVLAHGEIYALLEAPYQFLRPHLRRVYSLPAAASTVVGASRQRPWKRQPPYETGLDPQWGRNALMVLNGLSRRDLITGTQLGAEGGGAAGYSSGGRGYSYAGTAGGDSLPLPSSGASLGPNITFLSVALIRSAVAWAAPMYDRDGVNGITFGDDGLKYRYVWDGTEWAYDTGLTLPLGSVVACGHSIDATSVVSAVNGKTNVRTGLTNAARTSAFNVRLWIGWDNNSTNRTLDGVVLLNAIILETWSEAKLREWTLNPWQLFQPQRRRVSSFVAGGGTSSFSYTAVGGIVFAGAAAVLRARVLAAVGGLVFAGTAAMARAAARLASGGIVFGGSSPSSRNRVYQAVGGLVFSGAAAAARVASRAAAGGVVFAGAAATTFHSGVRTVVAAGGIIFGGNATVSYVGQRMSEWFLRNRRRRRH